MSTTKVEEKSTTGGRSHIFHLPPEIRDQIYAHYFETESTGLYTLRRRAEIVKIEASFKKSRSPIHMVPTALLGANRQIHNEASEVFYKMYTFHHSIKESDLKKQSFNPFGRTLLADGKIGNELCSFQLSLMRQISIDFCGHWPENESTEHSQGYGHDFEKQKPQADIAVAGCMKVIRDECKSLKSLRLTTFLVGGPNDGPERPVRFSFISGELSWPILMGLTSRVDCFEYVTAADKNAIYQRLSESLPAVTWTPMKKGLLPDASVDQTTAKLQNVYLGQYTRLFPHQTVTPADKYKWTCHRACSLAIGQEKIAGASNGMHSVDDGADVMEID